MTAAWTADQPMVKCTDVRKSFGAFEVLKGISLSVGKGEVVCIIGPSGSGKSTLIRCINALVPITSGTIHVQGIDVADHSATMHQADVAALDEHLFPRHNVDRAGLNRGRFRDVDADGASARSRGRTP